MNLNLPIKSLVCCAAYDKGDYWQINPSKYKGLGPNICLSQVVFRGLSVLDQRRDHQGFHRGKSAISIRIETFTWNKSRPFDHVVKDSSSIHTTVKVLGQWLKAIYILWQWYTYNGNMSTILYLQTIYKRWWLKFHTHILEPWLLWLILWWTSWICFPKRKGKGFGRHQQKDSLPPLAYPHPQPSPGVSDSSSARRRRSPADSASSCV